MYSSDTGYYRVDGYESTGAPDLELEVGQTYTFDQSHETNWYHPIGIASHWREFCHFADTPSPSLLKHLLKLEGGASE